MEEELVNCYLKRKINGQEIELAIIPEVDLCKCEPWMMGPRRDEATKERLGAHAPIILSEVNVFVS
uniref:NAC domain-containing protein n=1 Tax=Brassica oleracea var. oleracea TaxID=109376 RepID=A0A0D3BBV7_BRAOL